MRTYILHHKKKLILFAFFTAFFIASFGAGTTVKGIVKDAVTKQPLQSVSVYLKGGKGVTTQADGSFALTGISNEKTIMQVSYVGYQTATVTIAPGKEQVVEIELAVAESNNAVVVKSSKRGKYSNKNNPAVELIKKVIDNKSKNKVSSYDYVEYEQYEKKELALTRKPEQLVNSKLMKNYKFILDNNDTTKLEGKTLLPVYLEEKYSQKYYRKSPEKTKTFVLGDKKVNFDGLIDVNGISSYLDRLYEDVDIYQNNISILTNEFLSPIADMAPAFYRFYITDTIEKEGIKLIRMQFSPKNLEDRLFKGVMFVTLDGNYSVQQITMGISKHANVNWARELKIKQEFEKGPDGRYHVIKTNTIAEFAITKGSDGGILGERTVSLKNFTINKPQPESIYKGESVVAVNNVSHASDSFWTAHRFPQLSASEAKVYSNVDSLVKMSSFKRKMDLVTLLFAGYKGAGPFEVGPISTFYSFSPVEGFRLRFGGRTTPKFNKSVYFENYLAYGFKDEKLKYYLSGTYSFNHTSIYAYPLNYLRVSYQYDTKMPGQEMQFVQEEDNIFLAFKRGKNDKWLYDNTFNAEYVRELPKHLSVAFGFKNRNETPAGAISYAYSKELGNGDKTISNVTSTELSAELRWAPHEQFYQSKKRRIPIINKYPIFKFGYVAGIKGLANGEYNYHSLTAGVSKRTYLSQLGYTDVALEGGYTFGKVPFPLLTTHRTNPTYALYLKSYNLMNVMEFVSDHYVAADVSHYFNGFLFNKVPLVKKLKLREVVTAKVLYGGVRDENDPSKNPSTFAFPQDKTTGVPTTYALNNGPYAEIGFGIANIFKVVRVDYIKRLTYLNNPDVSKWGVRARVKFDF
jgi:hypothetical protein